MPHEHPAHRSDAMYLRDMTRRSATRLAVLGVVALEPSSGYAIRRSIAGSIGHFWSESFGQIYPTLADLASEGLVEPVRSDARSTTYGITDQGRTALLDLLRSDLSAGPPRDELLLRLFFGRFIGAQGCRDLLEDARAACHGQLARLAATRATLTVEDAHSPDLPYWLLTVRSGELTLRARIAWIDEALATVADLGGDPSW